MVVQLWCKFCNLYIQSKQEIMATLNFLIRTTKETGKARIKVRFRNGRDVNLYATTPFITDINEWDNKKGRLKPSAIYKSELPEGFNQEGVSTAQIITDGLEELEKVVFSSFNTTKGASLPKEWLQQIVDRYIASKRPKVIDNYSARNLNEYIQKYIDNAENGKMLTKKNELFAKGTIKSIRGFQSQFNNFQKYESRLIDFDDITMDFYNDFTQYLTIKRKYSINTVGRMIRILKTIMRKAREYKLHNNTEIDNQSFHAAKMEVDNIYLDESKLKILFDLDLSNRTAWEKCRDVFLIGCYTAQRFSDYSRINSKMIVRLDNNEEYIKITQKKTKKDILIPLRWEVKSILDRYNGVLPNVWEQKVNQHIKDICESVGFKEEIRIKETKAGLTTERKYPFYELVKTHTARRSGATNMQKGGVPLSDIMSITGHSSEAQLKAYLKLDAEQKAILASANPYFQNNKLKIG